MKAMTQQTTSHPPKEQLPADLVDIKPPVPLRISKVACYVMYVWVTIGIIALSLGVFLLLFSANPDTPFVKFVYKVASDYLDPFRAIFPAHPVGETGYFSVAGVFAIFVYLILMWLISSLISYVQDKIDESKRKQREILAYEQTQERQASEQTKRQ